MRINKYLAGCGVAGRRACDKIIEEGRVKIKRKFRCGIRGRAACIDEIQTSVLSDE